MYSDIIKKRGDVFNMEDSKETTAGDRILRLRLEKRYTREQLAYLADISVKFLYEIENNRKGFSSKTLVKLSEALETSMDYIMLGRDLRKSENEITAVLEHFKPDTLEQIERLLKMAYELSVKEK